VATTNDREGSIRVALRRGITPRYVLDLALEVMPDAAVVVDEDGEIVGVNDHAQRLFGYPAEELLGEYLELLVVEAGRRRGSSAILRHVDLTRSEMPEPLGRRRDGSQFPVEIGLQTIETENGAVTLATLRDITERRQIEKVKSDFIQNAAHELRTPLAAVAGLVSVLSQHRTSMSSDQLADTLGALARQGERARVLVNSLLDMTQLHHGRLDLTLEDVPVRAAIELALQAHPPPPDIQVEFQMAEDATVRADARRLTQVMVNLLTNAYRSGGSHIRVEGASMRKQVLIRVEDDGRGVPPELQPSLFEPFSRGFNRGPEGSGLGLALGRALVEAFRGDMWFEPVDPNGARFNIRIPRSH
jgi:PAS domain S-box-containing protein